MRARDCLYPTYIVPTEYIDNFTNSSDSIRIRTLLLITAIFVTDRIPAGANHLLAWELDLVSGLDVIKPIREY